MNPDNTDAKKGGWSGMTPVRIAFLSLLTIFVHLCFTEATAEFRGFGLIWACFLTFGIAFIAVPVAMIITAITWSLHDGTRGPRWLTAKSIRTFGLCLVVVGLFSGLYRSMPKARLAGIIDPGAHEVSDIRVAGFNGFLASRWLFSFNAPRHQVEVMAARLGLNEHPGIDLRKSLGRDIFFSSRATASAVGVPGAEGTRAFTRTEEHGQTASWVTLVYSESEEKAWLFTGFQN